MVVQAEVSLYPLKTEDLNEAIGVFVSGLQSKPIQVTPGTMSTLVTGEMRETLTAICEAFTETAENHQVVLVLKASNACPSGRPPGGQDAHTE